MSYKDFDDEEHVISLPTVLRNRAEEYFGYDLSSIRIHIDSEAAQSLGCVAFAKGADIHIQKRYFCPDEPWGQSILLHEIAHVVQQSQARVSPKDARLDYLYIDEVLEAEADKSAFEALSGVRRPRRALKALGSFECCPIQPIVDVNGIPYKKGGPNTFDSLWRAVSVDQYFTGLHLDKKTSDKVKTKLRHWVDAPAAATLFGKGHKKSFSGMESLIRSLHGRVTDRDSKALEGRLAKRISESRYIKRLIREFISSELVRLDAALKKSTKFKDELDAIDNNDKGRYAYFYSSGPGSMSKKYQRSLTEALAYMNSGKRSISEMCSFLCDYSMVARDVISDQMVPVIIPQADARATHFNVNEQSDWVKRARISHVRLGAGPSATTMNVMRMCKAILDNTEAAQKTMLCVALGLFAFWNLKKGNLQTRSEIHTYHEVMLVAHGYGLPTVPALNDRNVVMTEFEYPQETDIPA